MAQRRGQKGGAQVRLGAGGPKQRLLRQALCVRGLTARVGLFAASLSLAACTTVGPDFALPDAGWEEQWQSDSLADVRLGQPTGNWWEQFEDPALTAIVTAAEANNNNVKIAGLRVLEARAQLAGAEATRLPQLVVGSASAGYGVASRGNTPLGDADFLFGNVGAQVGWELDLWGRFRRAIEGSEAAWLASEAARHDVIILVRAEAARLYLVHRTLEERLVVLRENAALQRRNVEITGVLFRQGAANELDLQQALAQLLSTEAALPAIEQSITQTRNGLSVILGRLPGDLPELALSPARLPSIPGQVAVAVPADLLRRRPDVRTAAFQAAAQSARIGIAKADLYPSLSLGGSIQLGRTDPGLGNAVDILLGPGIRWNIFDFGQIRANVRVQDARFEQALFAYRDTVLQAAAEVDSTAVAFTRDQEEDVLLTQSLDAARRSLDLANLLYREGMVDFQRVLDAQSALLRQQDRQVSNRGEIAISLVLLYKALGGGWDLSATDDQLVDEATRERMRARVNWGGMLEPMVGKDNE